jgi:hypothetical protein
MRATYYSAKRGPYFIKLRGPLHSIKNNNRMMILYVQYISYFVRLASRARGIRITTIYSIRGADDGKASSLH